MAYQRPKDLAKCIDCSLEKQVRRDQLKRQNFWRCRGCTSKLLLEDPVRRQHHSERARWQVLRQGGIPNAVHFTTERVSGANSNNWKGGITPNSVKLRNSKEATEWRRAVLIRDNFTCQLCGQIGRKLQAYHDKPWSKFEELRYDIDNGITLCEKCHKDKAHGGSWKNDPTPWVELKWQFLTNA